MELTDKEIDNLLEQPKWEPMKGRDVLAAIGGVCVIVFIVWLAFWTIKEVAYDPAYNAGFEAGRASQMRDCQNRYDCSYRP